MDHSGLMSRYAEILRQIKKLEQEIEFLKKVEEDRAKKEKEENDGKKE